ncbi:MAG: adenylate kinase [Candidatus Helarchaeota archaeon]
MRLIFLGLPGAGKGTQAEKVRNKFNIPQISTGDILRENVRLGTDLGKKAASYMNEGKLVPDDVIIDMIKNRLSADDCKNGFILDGFPRTIKQANELENITSIDKVIFFDVPTEVLVERLSGRRSCKNCNAVYHIKFNPPKQPNVCDKCGSELYQREDDKDETVRKRIDAYNSQTKPLIEYYKNKSILITIDGSKPINEISSDIEKILKGKRID